MGRPTSVAGVRTVVIASRFTPAEAAWLDRERGSLSRAEYLRWLTVQERKRKNGV